MEILSVVCCILLTFLAFLLIWIVCANYNIRHLVRNTFWSIAAAPLITSAIKGAKMMLSSLEEDEL